MRHIERLKKDETLLVRFNKEAMRNTNITLLLATKIAPKLVIDMIENLPFIDSINQTNPMGIAIEFEIHFWGDVETVLDAMLRARIVKHVNDMPELD
tara:strand:+ start:472 stop:762 length:291 start_codon:yes stop_codon:yes gene_type:complete